MLKIPKLDHYPLSEALSYIAKVANNGKANSLWDAAFYEAIRRGELKISALALVNNKWHKQLIPHSFFETMDDSELSVFCNCSGNAMPYRSIDDETQDYKQATIETSALDAWLSSVDTATHSTVASIHDNPLADKWISLSAAIHEVAKTVGYSIAESRKCITNAIEDNKLEACGFRMHAKTREIIKPISLMDVIDTGVANDELWGCDGQLIPFVKVKVNRQQLEALIGKFVTKNNISKAPKPITALKGTGSIYRTASHYSVPVKDDDYTRCITDGFIKIHRLAALACDLSPPGNTAGEKQYSDDIRNSETKIGLICTKLVEAVKFQSLKTHESPFSTIATEWRHVALVDGIAWLEKQSGITISTRLKKYLNDNKISSQLATTFGARPIPEWITALGVADKKPANKKSVGRGKPKGMGAIDDSIALKKIAAVRAEYKTKHGQEMGVKTACESVAMDMEISEKERPATVDRLRRKYRDQASGQ